MPDREYHARGRLVFGAATIIGRAVQAGSVFALARYLPSDELGEVAVLAITFAALISATNLGFDRYIVRNAAADSAVAARVASAVALLQLIRCAAILAISAFGYLAFGIPSDVNVSLPQFLVVGIAAAGFSLPNPHFFEFEKAGDFFRTSIARSASGLALGATTILYAVTMNDSWAYPIGCAAGGAVYFLTTNIKMPALRISDFRSEDLLEIWDYSKHLVIIAVASFIIAQLENTYVAATMSASVIGTFYICHRLINVPREILSQVYTQVVFSAAAHLRRRKEEYLTLYYQRASYLIIVSSIFGIFLIFNIERIFLEIFNKEIGYIVWVTPYLVATSLLYAISITISPFLLLEAPQLASRLRVIEGVAYLGLALGLIFAFQLLGVLVAGIFIAAFASLARVFYFAQFDGTATVGRILWHQVLVVVASGGFALALELLLPIIHGHGLVLRLVLYTLLGMLLMFAARRVQLVAA